MQFTVDLSTVGDVIVICSTRTENRLKDTCFRDINEPRAGNFCSYRSVTEVLGDLNISVEFLEYVRGLLKDRCFGKHSVMIEHHDCVGWESTAEIGLFKYGELEHFEPNSRAEALKVSSSSKKAPLTKDVTIVFDLVLWSDNRRVVDIKSIYPGFDIGELNGDVTDREGRVFFDWNHLGEQMTH